MPGRRDPEISALRIAGGDASSDVSSVRCDAITIALCKAVRVDTGRATGSAFRR